MFCPYYLSRISTITRAQKTIAIAAKPSMAKIVAICKTTSRTSVSIFASFREGISPLSVVYSWILTYQLVSISKTFAT
jgi:hypothetical protein